MNINIDSPWNLLLVNALTKNILTDKSSWNIIKEACIFSEILVEKKYENNLRKEIWET